jgi:four helix bundle protein
MAEIIKTYRDLLVWQKSMSLVTDIYRLSRSFPKDETYGLTAQIRNCAVSIPSNIAEGFGRAPTDDYIRFLRMAVASLYELQTQLEISQNLEYIPKTDFDTSYESSREIERMLKQPSQETDRQKREIASVPLQLCTSVTL